jgi:hypothetical protein
VTGVTACCKRKADNGPVNHRRTTHASSPYCNPRPHGARYHQRFWFRLPSRLLVLRHTLLLPAMKPARRVKHAVAAPAVRWATALTWMGSLTIFGSAVLLAGWVFIPDRSADDEIDSAVKEIGFNPVKPANKLRGPGSIYVTEDQGFYHQVCPVHASDLNGLVQTSPAQAHVRERLEKGRFAWDADLVRLLNGKLGGNRVTSIKYSLSDVMLHEIADDALKGLERKLMQKPDCEDVVVQYYRHNRKICSGYAALSASASFKVYTEVRADIDLRLVKEHLEQHTGGQIQTVSRDEFSGENLFYGIRLSDIICAIPDDDKLPRRVAEPRA